METSTFKQTLRYVLVGICVLCVAALIFFGGTRYQKSKITPAEKYLQNQVEVVIKQVKYWREEYDGLLKEKEILLNRIDSLETCLKDHNKNYNEKVTTIMSYSSPKLERFFTERYRN